MDTAARDFTLMLPYLPVQFCGLASCCKRMPSRLWSPFLRIGIQRMWCTFNLRERLLNPQHPNTCTENKKTQRLMMETGGNIHTTGSLAM